MDFAVKGSLSPNRSHIWIHETDGYFRAFYFTVLGHARVLLQSCETNATLTEVLGFLLWEPGDSGKPHWWELLRPKLLFLKSLKVRRILVRASWIDRLAPHTHLVLWNVCSCLSAPKYMCNSLSQSSADYWDFCRLDWALEWTGII